MHALMPALFVSEIHSTQTAVQTYITRVTYITHLHHCNKLTDNDIIDNNK